MPSFTVPSLATPEKNARLTAVLALLLTVATLSGGRITFAQERPGQPLENLNVSYASVTGSRIPLWIAKDAGLFEKYGLNVNLIVIAAGSAAIGALAGGDVEILGAPGSTTMVSAARGLPFAIIGTFGPSAWKLAAPSFHHFDSRTERQNRGDQPARHNDRLCHKARVGEARFQPGKRR
jgi:hypothetical protein